MPRTKTDNGRLRIVADQAAACAGRKATVQAGSRNVYFRMHPAGRAERLVVLLVH